MLQAELLQALPLSIVATSRIRSPSMAHDFLCLSLSRSHQKHWHHLKTEQKFLGLIPDLLNENLHMGLCNLCFKVIIKEYLLYFDNVL